MIAWDKEKFQYYLEGRLFILLTDHKPLTTIFHPHKGISATASARIQPWALFLSGVSYQIEYKNTKAHANSDGMSKLPLNCTKEDEHRKDPAGRHFPLKSNDQTASHGERIGEGDKK